MLNKALVNKNISKPGNITIQAEEVSATANSEMVIFNPEVKGLKSSSLCFFIIYRNITPGKFTPIYKSEIKQPSNDAYQWNQVQVGSTDLCKDNIE